MELTPGTVLLGKYRVDEVLGTGGMGRVVRASHQYLNQSVAIKILLPQMAESPSTVARFLREAQATVRLKNEHVARVIDVGTTADGTPFMVMEYLEGNDLNQILRHHGPQAPNIVVDLMLQACEGMSEAHAQGIIHRDIKPSNYFITQRPDGSMLLKILDFGISKTPVDFTELTGTQTVIGTPSYMAPEQMKSGKQADARSDIWSMGVVMYQLLQGRPPFSGESYAELVLKVGAEPPTPLHVPLPAGLGEVIFRCMEKDPKQRPQDVGELARSLAPFASDPISAAQIAARTTRILLQRTGGQQGLPVAAAGGLTAPVPLSPAQLTPRSWPPSSTSLSQGHGQVTLKTKGSKGWLVAGALSVAILAGTGGYLASSLRRSSAGSATSDEPAEAPAVRMQAQPAPSAEPPATPSAPSAAPATTAPSSAGPTTATTAAPTPSTAPTTATTATTAPSSTAPTSAPSTPSAGTAPTSAPATPSAATTSSTPAIATTPTKTATTVAGPATKTETTVPAPPAKSATTVAPPPAKSATTVGAPATKTATTAATANAATTSPTKTATAKTATPPSKTTATTTPAKTVTAPTKTSPTPAKTTTKTTPGKTSTKSNDLFDSRH